jgi:hypothetical protein
MIIKPLHYLFMRVIRSFLFLISSLLATGLQAQKDYLPGTLVLNNGDTLSGYIEYQNWSRTPTSIEFKRTPAAATETFTLRELKGFAIKDADKFHKAVIWKEYEPDNFTAQRYEALPRRQDTVFLRSVVEAARFSLYEYTDERSHYFIRPAGDTLQELLNPSEYNTATAQFTTRAVYRDQLRLYAVGHPQKQQLLRKIEAAPYRETHFKAIVRQIVGKEGIAYSSRDKAITTRQVFVLAGVLFNTNLIKRDNPSAAESYNKTNFQLNGGVDFFSLKRFQHMFFRAELRVGKSSYKNEFWELKYTTGSKLHRYDVDYLSFNPALHVLFPLVRTDKAQFYGGGGLSYTILKSTRYSHTVAAYASGPYEEGPRDGYANVHGGGGTLLTLGWMHKNGIELKAFHNLRGFIIPEVNKGYSGFFLGYRF